MENGGIGDKWWNGGICDKRWNGGEDDKRWEKGAVIDGGRRRR